ncbi:acyltransferase [Aeromonas veronii]|uniref:acyltransferase n=1 Tax=Aeromonas veronii TaxID=654 RepID=UPI003D248DDE
MKKMIIKVLQALRIKKMNGVEYARSIGVKVGENCRLIDVTFSSEPYLVIIGNHVSATRTHFETHDGGLWVFREQHPDWDIIKPIIIGNNVYIGTGVTILPGVSIGDNVIVGAASVVTKDLEPNSVYAGIPAKKIKNIDEYFHKIKHQVVLTKGLSVENKYNFLINMFNNKSGS